MVLHFSMMLAFSCFYMMALARSLIVRAHVLWSGAVYGVAIFGFMNVVVLPLPAFPHKLKYAAALLTIGILTHILCVGLAWRSSQKNMTATPNYAACG